MQSAVTQPHDLDQAKKAIASIRHLDSLTPSLQETLARLAVEHRFDPGQVIYLEGDPASHLFILQAGWVKATRISREGREQAMLFLGPGEVFGDVALFNDIPYPGTVTALEPVRVWMIERTALLALLRQQPDLALAVIRRLSDRVLHYIQLVEDLSLRSVESRLAYNLLQNVEYHQGALIIPRRTWATYDEMAVRLGTVRDVLSRALHALEEEGILRVERRQITVLDLERLADRGRI